MIKISIIVPIYNADKYLNRCIDSLLNQTLKDIEIILVNDGSNDKSPSICNEYKIKDSRIVVIHKQNAGVSSARNTGIKEARGKYIAFVDADDYVNSDMCNSMFNNIEKTNADMCVSNYIIRKAEKELVVNHKLKESIILRENIIDKIVPSIICGEDLKNKNNLVKFRGPVMYLYKKDTLVNYNLEFKVGLPIGEDFLFNISYMLKINKLAVDQGSYYHYCINEESAIHTYRKDYWEIRKILISEIKYLIKDQKIYASCKSRINFMIMNYLIASIVQICNNALITSTDKLSAIKKITQDGLTENTLSKLSIKRISVRNFILLYLIKKKKNKIIYIYMLSVNRLINVKSMIMKMRNN